MTTAETVQTTLTEFLLARIAEDEDPERLCESWHSQGAFGCSACDRVLAECEAKRRIVELHADDQNVCASCDDLSNPYLFDGSLTGWPCPTLRALAAIYAGHRDYRDEWRG